MFKFGKCVLKNFGPFKNEEIDFRLPGLTAIDGRNGSGKTMLIEAIIWCITGRMLREGRGGDVLRVGSTGGGSVSLTIEQEDGPDINVIRYIQDAVQHNNVRVWVGEEEVTSGTNPLTDASLEKMLHTNYYTLINTIAFVSGEDVESYYQASDDKTKEVFGRLLGLTVYALASAEAMKQAKALSAEIEEAENQLETDARATAVAEAHLVEFTRVSERGLEQKRLERVVSLLVATREKEAADKALQEALNDVTDAHTRGCKALEAYNQQVDDYNHTLADLQRQLQTAKSAKAVAVKSLETMNERIRRMERLGTGSCITCEHPITTQSKAAVLASLKKDLSPLGAQADAAEMECEAIQRQIDELQVPVQVPDPAKAGSEAVYAVAEKRMAAATERFEKVEESYIEADKELQEHSRRLGALQSAYAEACDRHTKQSEALASLQRKMEQLNFCATGFGNKGIRAYLIEAALPEISHLAQGFAVRLFGDGAYVSISATTALKNSSVKERINIEGKLPGMAQTYGMASRSQRKRLDLAIRLGIYEYARKRRPTNFQPLFVDELLDSLDEVATHRAIGILQEMAGESPIFLTSHSPHVRSYANQIIFVTHNGSTTNPEATLSMESK
jgi:DNA repair exonuclease SbcCD ATPase subunit